LRSYRRQKVNTEYARAVALNYLTNFNLDAPVEVKKVAHKSPMRKAAVESVDDGIAEDVRKIKESMKEPAKKSRRSIKSANTAESPPPPPAAATLPASKPRGRPPTKQSKQEKLIVKDEVAVPAAEKFKTNNELKKELLADWDEDEDDDVVKPEKVKKEGDLRFVVFLYASTN